MKKSRPTAFPSSRAGLVAAALLFSLPTAQAARDLATLEGVERKLQAIPPRTRASVVALLHSMKVGTNSGMASGSGTIVSEDGLILTAAHVVDGADTVDVVFPDGKKVTAKILGCDFDHDLALAKITEPGRYPFVELGESETLKVGDDVAALGHSGGFDPNRPAPVRYGRIFKVDPGKLLRSDCILVGGDSGGPLFDLDGKLIGVHTSVSDDPSVNNDVPVDVAKAGWERLLKGERWGVNRESATDLTDDELAGLDMRAFRRTLTEEAVNAGGKPVTDPEKLRKWMLEAGMNKDRVEAMSADEMKTFAFRSLMIHGQDSELPDIPKEELAGLDLAKFRDQVMDGARKSGGQLQATPDTIAGWLRAAGMQEEKVKTMDPGDLIGFLGKVLGESAELKAETTPLEEAGEVNVPEGLDLEKLRAVLMEEAKRTQGKLEATPEAITGWLQKAGMDESKAKALPETSLPGLISKAMGGAAKVETQQVPHHGIDNPQDLEGVDTGKFKKLITDAAMKNQGKLALEPATISTWLRECGMPEEKATSLSPGRLSAAVKAIMGKSVSYGTAPVLTPDQKIIAGLDLEVLKAIRPGASKIAPSVVTFTDGTKTLAMGTIVKADGFILTKHSEIARAGEGKLKVRLADGRIFPATEVSTFSDHDLALVKIDATSLPAVEISSSDPTPVPGSFLFSPGSGVNAPLLGSGVMSVVDRSLKESGAFLGILMKETPEGVEIEKTVADSPATKAGLQGKDRLVSFNGTAFKTPAEVSAFVRTLKPQDKMQIAYQRDGEEHAAEVVLAERPRPTKEENPAKAMTSIGTKTSEVSEGFPLIFQDDLQLTPQDCGSAVMDLHGNFVGINIARAGRVDSYAIPARTIGELLATVDFGQLKNTTAAGGK
ncbi:trypsin-like peptidase domain-containing protein [Luteolibacter sp. LG18]|uniref:S1C family serine protease n=1 Tax=Luteolibacter sp. LG18 TaxID=2819286 RepID=UPI0030C719E2